MSNISTVENKPVRATLSRPATVTAPRPNVAVRARLVSYPQRRQRAKAKRMDAVLSQCIMFACLTFLTYGVSTISGQVMVEQSRREEASAKTTTLGALRTETALKSRIQSITDPQAIANWASVHNFTSQGAGRTQAPKNDVLALRD